jgi:hypothetical protein
MLETESLWSGKKKTIKKNIGYAKKINFYKINTKMKKNFNVTNTFKDNFL